MYIPKRNDIRVCRYSYIHIYIYEQEHETTICTIIEAPQTALSFEPRGVGESLSSLGLRPLLLIAALVDGIIVYWGLFWGSLFGVSWRRVGGWLVGAWLLRSKPWVLSQGHYFGIAL